MIVTTSAALLLCLEARSPSSLSRSQRCFWWRRDRWSIAQLPRCPLVSIMDLSAVLRQGHDTYDVRFRGFGCRAREFLSLQQRPRKMLTEGRDQWLTSGRIGVPLHGKMQRTCVSCVTCKRHKAYCILGTYIRPVLSVSPAGSGTCTAKQCWQETQQTPSLHYNPGPRRPHPKAWDGSHGSLSTLL